MSTCTSQDNSLNFLKKKNIIDQERRLQISPEAFELMQQKLIDFAKQEYGYDNGNFYTIETSERKAIQGHNYHRDNKVTIHRIVPVEENFKVLDNLRVSNDEDVAFSLDFFEDTIEEQQEIEPSFETFIKYKQTLKRRINKRLAKIKADKKKFASDKEQLSRLVALEKELTTRLEGDESLGIIGLEGEIGMLLDTPTIEKINFYAEKDLTRLEALSNSENPEDLVEAKTIVNFYEALGTFSTATDNPLFTIDQMFNENGELLLPESTIETLNKLKETVIAQKNKIYQKEKTFVENFINENSKIQNITEGEGVTYEQAFYTKEGLKDTTWIDMFVMDITNGIFSHNGIVPQVMYSTLQEDMEKHLVYAKSVEARMNELQPKVEKILLEKGYKVPWTKKGVSYDLFRAKTSGGLTQDSVTQRYSSVYNEARNKMVSKFSEEIEKARQIDNAVQRSVAFKNANSKRLNWYRKNTIVIDIRKIPELAEINKELNGPILDFPGHKDKLIEVLGEKGYAEEVENQRKLLKEFQTNAEVFKESLLEKEGVSDIESLSKEGQIELEDWNNRHNPYLMVESYYSSEPIKSKITGRETSPNMTYNYAVPRNKKALVSLNKGKYKVNEKPESSNYYDERFKEIEENEDLKAFHDLLTEVNDKIYETMPPKVREKLNAHSIPALKKSIIEILFDPNTPMLQRISAAFRQIIEGIKTSFGVNVEDSLTFLDTDPITGKPEYEVNSSFLKSNKPEIKGRHAVELQRIKKAMNISSATKIKRFDVLNIQNNPEVITILAENLGIENSLEAVKKRFPEVDLSSAPISSMLYEAITDQVVKENSFDLPKIIKMYSYLTMEYAARQEALPNIEMLKNHYEDIRDTKRTSATGETRVNAETKESVLDGERANAIKQMDSWFDRAVLGVYESKNELGDTRLKRDMRLKLKLTKEEEETVAQEALDTTPGNLLTKREKILKQKIETNIQELDTIINTSPSEDEVKEATRLKATHVKTLNSLGKEFTATAVVDNILRFIRLKGLGWNVSSYVTNFAEGQIANLTVAASGDYFTPENIYRANHIVKGSFLKNMTASKIATPNAKKTTALMERYRILQDASNELQKASTKSTFSKLRKLDPYEGTRRTEYLNQAPLMISILLDTQIEGKNGETSNVFDAMDENGKFKEEFRTEENIKNWEEANGKTYFDFKAKINKTIVNTHGDYDELRGSMASERMSGKILLMFKRWMARQVYQRFAMTPQTDIEVGIKEYRGRYTSHTAATGTLHGAILGFGGLALVGGGLPGLLIGGAVGGTIGKFFGRDSGMSYLQELALQTKELSMTLARIPVNNLVGKNIITQEKYKKALEKGMADAEGKKGAIDQRDINNIKANMIDMSVSLFFIGMLLLTKALFWVDDDEDETRRGRHNLLANRFMQLSGQSAMYLNPTAMFETVSNMAFIKFLTDVGNVGMAAQEVFEGRGTLMSGPNAGQNKLAVKATKLFIPNVIQDPLSLGMSSQKERQFTPSAFDKWFYGAEKVAQNEIKARRASYRSDLREQGIDEGTVKTRVDERYPPKQKGESYVDVLKRIPE